MKKKRSAGSRLISNSRPHNPVLNHRNFLAGDLFVHARSFHTAAKKLAAAFQPDVSVLPEADASPVIFMYRHALEVHLKTIVLGSGGNFLAKKPDEISVGKTHSVSWLAQFVAQIVTAVGWQVEFRCEGIDSLSDFKAVVEQVSDADPGSYSFRCPVDPRSKSSVMEFVRRMDAVIGLLDATADALAAEWDMRSEAPTEAHWNGGGFEPTIQ